MCKIVLHIAVAIIHAASINPRPTHGHKHGRRHRQNGIVTNKCMP